MAGKYFSSPYSSSNEISKKAKPFKEEEMRVSLIRFMPCSFRGSIDSSAAGKGVGHVPRPPIHLALCASVPACFKPNALWPLCTSVPMFPSPYVPQSLFPSSYVLHCLCSSAAVSSSSCVRGSPCSPAPVCRCPLISVPWPQRPKTGEWS